MVHRSMRNGSRVADETVYKESVVGVGGFPFLLSLLVLLYSKASHDFEIASTLVLSWSPRNEYRTSYLVFWYHIIVTSITYVRPCPLHQNEFYHNVPDIECAYIPQLRVSFVSNLALFLVGFTYHPTVVGYTFATIASTNYCDLPNLISVSTPTGPHFRMHKYDSNCTSQTYWFDLAGTPCLIFEPEPLNAFDSIEAILKATFKEEPLEAYFW